MTRLALALFAGVLSTAGPAAAQSTTVESDLTAGRSTDDATAAAVQLRVFGASRTDWRYFAEVAWGRGGSDSDAFGAAYPYDNAVHPMEAYIEKTFSSTGRLFGVRLGRFRTPFGISGRSDHAYAGFTRAPLVRYGQNWAISNTFLEAGGDVLAGWPALYAEVSAGVPSDEGSMPRRRGTDLTVRGQAFYRSFIVGASVMRTQPNEPPEFAFGRMVFRGIDARWTNRGVQLRGEWMDGRPFDGVMTRGGYLDAFVHERRMGPVTAVARIERLDYVADIFSEYLRRFTAGAHVRIGRAVEVQIDVLRQSAAGMLSGSGVGRPTALDAGLTYSFRY